MNVAARPAWTDTRTVAHSVLVAGGISTIAALVLTSSSKVTNATAPGIAAGALAFGATAAIINYTSHNGTLHNGKQPDGFLEDALIGAAVGGVTGLIPIGNHGLSPITAAIVGACGGFLSGAALHFFNRPTH